MGRFSTPPPPTTAKTLKAVDQNFSTMTDSGTNTGIILQTVPIGNLNEILNLTYYVLTVRTNLTALGATANLEFGLNVRDATVHPSVTVAQFIAAPLGVVFSISATGRTVSGWAVLVTIPYAAADHVYNGADIQGHNTDNYGNALSTGDSLVLDFGLWCNKNKSNFTGTWSQVALYQTLSV